MPGMSAIARSIGALVDLFLPRGCPACDHALDGDDGPFCVACALAIGRDGGQDYCSRCGTTAEPYLVAAAGCPQCREFRVKPDAMARAGTYGGPVGELVKQLKFRGRQRLDDPLGGLLAEALRRYVPIDDLDALVPVPEDWGSWWRYRFHPAGALARCVGRRLGVPVIPVVRMARRHRRQAPLPASERIRNVRGAFRTARGARLEGACVCVIDDVSTTGATLREMTRVLKDAGAERVFAGVAAKTQLGVDDYPE
ncbi:MAG: amidophosphoribosyltransferase [Phycisphaerae bacterium]|jgi:ComF family protein